MFVQYFYDCDIIHQTTEQLGIWIRIVRFNHVKVHEKSNTEMHQMANIHVFISISIVQLDIHEHHVNIIDESS